MLTRRVIPCLDTRDGRVVKGVRFQDLRDAGTPAALASRYQAEGADEIVVLDVTATPEGRGNALATVRAVRAVLSIPLTVGGGVRSVADAERLLSEGADKVAVNSAALARPELLAELADTFGRQCITLAIDARRKGPTGWEVLSRSGSVTTGWGAVDWAMAGEAQGAGEILLTSMDQDGTRAGYDLALIGAIAPRVTIPIVASGGGASVAHMREALAAGADAVLAASMFHDGDLTVAQTKQALAAAGVEIRL